MAVVKSADLPLHNYRIGLHLILVLALTFSGQAWSANPEHQEVLILTSSDASHYQRAAATISRKIDQACRQIPDLGCTGVSIRSLAQISGESLAGLHLRLLVTLGSEAAHQAESIRDTQAIITALLPEATARNVLEQIPGEKKGGVFLEQPLERLLQLAMLSKHNHRPVGLLLSNDSKLDIGRLRGLAKRMKIAQPVIRTLERSSDVGKVLGRLLEEIGILIAVPDSRVYNRKTVVNILLSTYRRRVPVLGFSPGFTRAGAMVSLYTQPEQIGRQVSELALQYLATGRIPPLQAPKYYSVEINQSVAASLGIPLPDAETLQKRLQEAMP